MNLSILLWRILSFSGGLFFFFLLWNVFYDVKRTQSMQKMKEENKIKSKFNAKSRYMKYFNELSLVRWVMGQMSYLKGLTQFKPNFILGSIFNQAIAL